MANSVSIRISTTFESKIVLTLQQLEGCPVTNVFKPQSLYVLLDEDSS
jgi:hypothetical protein